MEQRQFVERVMELSNKFYNLLLSGGIMSDAYLQQTRQKLDESVAALLQAEKPKIMVYGIYNSGKSTLVNSLCEKAVAEVADRPMTSTIAEYDAGKYILIDSPGVNAPMEHEQIADRHLKNCHAILFVISSKGLFEDRQNYIKMLNLMKRDIPFYIILNDRGYEIPPKEKGEQARKQAEDLHTDELKRIRRKIISNLIAVSEDEKVEEKYETIVLNAKRAWVGIERQKLELVEKSRLPILRRRIEELLHEKGVSTRVYAPLSALDGLMSDAEHEVLQLSGQSDYADQRRKLEDKITIFKIDILADSRSAVMMQHDKIYNAILDSRSDMSEIMDEVWDDVCDILEQNYTLKIRNIADFAKNNFPGLDLRINERPPVRTIPQPFSEKLEVQTKGPSRMAHNASRYGELAGTPVRGSGSASGSIKDIIKNLFKSRDKKEKEEFERLQAEVALANQEVEDRVAELGRIRQDARANTQQILDKMSRQLRGFLNQALDEKFSDILLQLDTAVQEQEQTKQAVRQLLGEIKSYREELVQMKRALQM